MAKTIIAVDKNRNENDTSLLRRFSRKVRDAGIIREVRNRRYSSRKPSALTLKQGALKRMERRAHYSRLRKLGKIK